RGAARAWPGALVAQRDVFWLEPLPDRWQGRRAAQSAHAFPAGFSDLALVIGFFHIENFPGAAGRVAPLALQSHSASARVHRTSVLPVPRAGLAICRSAAACLLERCRDADHPLVAFSQDGASDAPARRARLRLAGLLAALGER